MRSFFFFFFAPIAAGFPEAGRGPGLTGGAAVSRGPIGRLPQGGVSRPSCSRVTGVRASKRTRGRNTPRGTSTEAPRIDRVTTVDLNVRTYEYFQQRTLEKTGPVKLLTPRQKKKEKGYLAEESHIPCMLRRRTAPQYRQRRRHAEGDYWNSLGWSSRNGRRPTFLYYCYASKRNRCRRGPCQRS